MKRNAANVERAILTLTRLPGFAKADAAMRKLTEPIVRELERSAPPKPQAITWFDKSAENYLALVTDHDSWDSYRVWLYELLYPTARYYLFGWPNVDPVSNELLELASRLDARLRYWHQRASETLAECLEVTRIEAETSSTKSEPSLAAAQVLNPEFPARDWNEVEISFFNEHSVQITVGQTKVIADYGQLGMADRRSGKPNLAWQTLYHLAQSQGVLDRPEAKSRNWVAVEKRIQEVRARLRQLFHLVSDPLPFREQIGYKAKFQINCARSHQP